VSEEFVHGAAAVVRLRQREKEIGELDAEFDIGGIEPDELQHLQGGFRRLLRLQQKVHEGLAQFAAAGRQFEDGPELLYRRLEFPGFRQEQGEAPPQGNPLRILRRQPPELFLQRIDRIVLAKRLLDPRQDFLLHP
jgi:hypothetical protein